MVFHCLSVSRDGGKICGDFFIVKTLKWLNFSSGALAFPLRAAREILSFFAAAKQNSCR
jgi:hypothetical protein